MVDTISRGGGRIAVALALGVVYVVWGSTYFAIRVALEGFPPFMMAGLRFLVAGSLLYAFVRLRGASPPGLRQWGGASAVGALLLFGGNGGVVLAEQWVASGLVALGVASVALWSALFAGLWGAWPRRSEWLGLGLGFAGVVLLNAQASLRASPAGAVALLVATVSWSFGSMWSRRLPLPSGLMAPAAQMLAGGAILLVAGIVRGEALSQHLAGRAVWAFAYLVVFGSWLGFSAYLFLLQRVRPTLATSYAYVNPVIALVLGVWLGGETITAGEWLAVPIILAGVALVVLSKGRGQGPQAPAERVGPVRVAGRAAPEAEPIA
jgi:drug/metabolite transporter (DMT)-like permease